MQNDERRQVTLVEALKADVRRLSQDIGERNTQRYENLSRAAAFITSTLRQTDLPIRSQTYTVEGKLCENIEAELLGRHRPQELVIVSAHYDSARGVVGANDNASGVAALLALACMFAHDALSRTVRFVAFVNEEPPYTRTPQMGSVVYAHRCRLQQEDIHAMISLETIGYYPWRERPAKDPLIVRWVLRPLQGNFLACVGNPDSRPLVQRVTTAFQGASDLPIRGFVLPGFLPGVKSSDHWAFWQQGYKALMLTDTAPFRYPFYHTRYDTPDKLTYNALAEAVKGLKHVVQELACLPHGA
jgi:Zn-dependent M28 family amino/carboxypeptidase